MGLGEEQAWATGGNHRGQESKSTRNPGSWFLLGWLIPFHEALRPAIQSHRQAQLEARSDITHSVEMTHSSEAVV